MSNFFKRRLKSVIRLEMLTLLRPSKTRKMIEKKKKFHLKIKAWNLILSSKTKLQVAPSSLREANHSNHANLGLKSRLHWFKKVNHNGWQELLQCPIDQITAEIVREALKMII